MNTIPLAGRIAATMTMVLAIAIGLSVAMSQATWRRMLYTEGYASCAATAADLREAIDDKLQLGIPLSGLGNTQQLIERMLHANSAIADVAVLDLHGTILFATEILQIGGAAPAGWSAPRPGMRSWSAPWRNRLLAADTIGDANGVVGSVVVLYDATDIETKLGTGLLHMARAGVLLLLGGIMASAIAATLISREARLWSRRFCAQVQAAGTADPAPPAETAMARLIRATHARLRRCEADLLRLGTTHDSEA